MFCTKCGSQQPDGQRFCSACGATLGAAPGAPQQAQRPVRAAGAGGFDVGAISSVNMNIVAAALALLGMVTPFVSFWGFKYSILNALGDLGDVGFWFVVLFVSTLAIIAGGARGLSEATVKVDAPTKKLLALIAAAGGAFILVYILWNMIFNELAMSVLGFGAYMLMLASAAAIYAFVLESRGR